MLEPTPRDPKFLRHMHQAHFHSGKIINSCPPHWGDGTGDGTARGTRLEALRDDAALLRRLVAKNGRALRFASARLRNSRRVTGV